MDLDPYTIGKALLALYVSVYLVKLPTFLIDSIYIRAAMTYLAGKEKTRVIDHVVFTGLALVIFFFILIFVAIERKKDFFKTTPTRQLVEEAHRLVKKLGKETL